MRGLQQMIVVGILAALGGCCGPFSRDDKPLPPVIGISEQSRRLAEWSAKLPRIKATTTLAGVRLEYRDDQGGDHAVNAEGTLRIEQHPAASPLRTAPGADVLLLGRSFDQPAFEAGRNPTNWWFAVKIDRKEAWVGDATRPVSVAALGGQGTANILRADLVPDLLGLSPLPPVEGGTPAAPGSLLYQVDDATRTNRLYVLQGLRVQYAAGTVDRPIIAREIVVDRDTGHISQVRMYDADGVVVVQSELSDYATVSYGEGVAVPEVPAKFPHKVVVNYPGRHLTIALKFGDVEVPAEFKPAVFVMPKFEGFKVYAGE